MTRLTEDMGPPLPHQSRPHPVARRVIISVALLVVFLAMPIGVYQQAASGLDERLKVESAASHFALVTFSTVATSTMSYDGIVTLMSSYGMRLNFTVAVTSGVSQVTLVVITPRLRFMAPSAV
jgi:hypothetical protein